MHLGFFDPTGSSVSFYLGLLNQPIAFSYLLGMTQAFLGDCRFTPSKSYFKAFYYLVDIFKYF
jgi:hypothetical protein